MLALEEELDTEKRAAVIEDIYNVLEKHGLNDIMVFDEQAKTFKSVEDLCINGTCLQINTEFWPE